MINLCRGRRENVQLDVYVLWCDTCVTCIKIQAVALVNARRL
jgi:hypothetical protein